MKAEIHIGGALVTAVRQILCTSVEMHHHRRRRHHHHHHHHHSLSCLRKKPKVETC